MSSRRDFFGYASAVALSASLPARSAGQQRLPPRLIPDTTEALPVIGLGNSSAFRAPDLTGAARVAAGQGEVALGLVHTRDLNGYRASHLVAGL